ncbi:MAG: FtsB family cell division protein [Pseudomonadota bacterium]
MRLALTVLLVVALGGLQYRLWFGDTSVASVQAKEARLDDLEAELRRLEARNRILASEVDSLREGLGAVEAQARLTLGFIRPDEHFYQVIEAVRPDTITPVPLESHTVPRLESDD